MQLPGSNESNVMMVANADAFTGSIVDPKEIESQNVRFQEEKKALAALETCLDEKNLTPVLHLLLDEGADIDGRKKALSLLPLINDLSCIDPIRNHSFRDPSLESDCNMALAQMLKANYKKECLFCMEIIKSQAQICMHCKKEV